MRRKGAAQRSRTDRRRRSVLALPAARPAPPARGRDLKITFSSRAWEDYLWWRLQDRKTLKRINTLIADITGNGNEGSANRNRSSTDSRATGRAASTTSTG